MADETAASIAPAAGGEGDDDQLPEEDTLIERGVDDLLDEGYTVPERPRPECAHWGETAWEESHGETLDQRFAEEEPEIWESDPPIDPSRQRDRAGRLSEDDTALEAGGNDQFAVDEGVSGGAATAEEAAVHIVDDDEL